MAEQKPCLSYLFLKVAGLKILLISTFYGNVAVAVEHLQFSPRMADQSNGCQLNETLKNMLKVSKDMTKRSYCPYSKLRVGAALLCQDGTMYTGCNVENVNHNLSICAERTAIVKAVADGHKIFTAVAIASDLKDSFITPCGSCRQYMLEFGKDYDVYMTNSDMEYKKMKTGDLLPLAFTPEARKEERIRLSY